MKNTLLSALVCLTAMACQSERPQGWIDMDQLLDPDPKDWLTLGGSHFEQHYSPLNLINKQNVRELGFAWEADARSPIGRVPRGLEATPIVVDGIMYTSGAWVRLRPGRQDREGTLAV